MRYEIQRKTSIKERRDYLHGSESTRNYVQSWVEESRSSPYKVFMEDPDWGRNG